MTDSALGMPLAVSVVPSSGSTAMSASGGAPSPIRSPLKSIGASSFSPSPMTTKPSMWAVSSTRRIASTAAWSAASLSPMPTRRAAASAAASVTRTSSRARLRSGRLPSIGSDDPRGLADALGLRRSLGRAEEHEQDAEQGDEPSPREVDGAVRVPRAAAEGVEEQEAERRDRHHRRQLAPRPGELVPADDDVGEDEGRERGEEQQPAQDRVDVPAREGPGRPVDRHVRVRRVRRLPRQEKRDEQEEAAPRGA